MAINCNGMTATGGGAKPKAVWGTVDALAQGHRANCVVQTETHGEEGVGGMPADNAGCPRGWQLVGSCSRMRVAGYGGKLGGGIRVYAFLQEVTAEEVTPVQLGVGQQDWWSREAVVLELTLAGSVRAGLIGTYWTQTSSTWAVTLPATLEVIRRAAAFFQAAGMPWVLVGDLNAQMANPSITRTLANGQSIAVADSPAVSCDAHGHVAVVEELLSHAGALLVSGHPACGGELQATCFRKTGGGVTSSAIDHGIVSGLKGVAMPAGAAGAGRAVWDTASFSVLDPADPHGAADKALMVNIEHCPVIPSDHVATLLEVTLACPAADGGGASGLAAMACDSEESDGEGGTGLGAGAGRRESGDYGERKHWRVAVEAAARVSAGGTARLRLNRHPPTRDREVGWQAFNAVVERKLGQQMDEHAPERPTPTALHLKLMEALLFAGLRVLRMRKPPPYGDSADHGTACSMAGVCLHRLQAVRQAVRARDSFRRMQPAAAVWTAAFVAVSAAGRATGIADGAAVMQPAYRRLVEGASSARMALAATTALCEQRAGATFMQRKLDALRRNDMATVLAGMQLGARLNRSAPGPPISALLIPPPVLPGQPALPPVLCTAPLRLHAYMQDAYMVTLTTPTVERPAVAANRALYAAAMAGLPADCVTPSLRAHSGVPTTPSGLLHAHHCHPLECARPQLRVADVAVTAAAVAASAAAWSRTAEAAAAAVASASAQLTARRAAEAKEAGLSAAAHAAQRAEQRAHDAGAHHPGLPCFAAPHPQPLPAHHVTCLGTLNRELTLEELLRVLRSLKCGKAAGLDGVTAEMLKALAADGVAMAALLNMLSNILAGYKAVDMRPPLGLAPTFVTLLFKGKGSRQVFRNYRGIAVTSTIYKLLTTIMERRLTEHLEMRLLLHTLQNGFRRRRSCQQQVFGLLETIALRRRSGLPTYVAYVDLAEAYPSVTWNRLVAVLWRHGVRGGFLQTLRALYEDMTVVVNTGLGSHEARKPTQGLKQGCPLSCLLFALYINDAIEMVEKEAEEQRQAAGGEPLIPPRASGGGDGTGTKDGVHLGSLWYADDGALMAPTPERLQRLLNVLGRAFDEALQTCNTLKTHAQEFVWAAAHTVGTGYTFDGVPITTVREFCYLGMWVDSNLTMVAHVAHLVKKSCACIGVMRSQCALGSHAPMRLVDRFSNIFHDPSLDSCGEFLCLAADGVLAPLDLQQARRDLSVAGAPPIMWGGVPADRLRREFGRNSQRLRYTARTVLFVDRLARLTSEPVPVGAVYSPPDVVGAILRRSFAEARDLRVHGGPEALQAARFDTVCGAAAAAMDRLCLWRKLGASMRSRPPQGVVNAAVREAVVTETAAELRALAAATGGAAYHAQRFACGQWMQHTGGASMMRGHSALVLLRIGAGPISPHRAACGVGKSRRCPCGAVEEDVYHALLCCPQACAAALALRPAVAQALQRVHPSALAASVAGSPLAREWGKVLVGASMMVDAGGTKRHVPQELADDLEMAVVAYLQEWVGPRSVQW